MSRNWMGNLQPDARKRVAACRAYATDPCGMPAHHLMVLIADLADLLDQMETSHTTQEAEPTTEPSE